MLEEDIRREIQVFVKEKAALTGEASEGDFYFKVVVGRSTTKQATRSQLNGIYISKHPDVTELCAVVERHVERSIRLMNPERQRGERFYLIFSKKGENNPDDGIELPVAPDPRGGLAEGSAAEQIKATQGIDGTFNAAASVALLETNNMLRGLLLRFMEDLRTVLEQKTNAEGLITEALAKLSTAEAMVEVMANETEIRKVDRFFDRMDPHLAAHGGDVVETLGILAKGWSFRQQAGKSKCPPKPGPATDWHLAQFEGALYALGEHLEAHPETLTPERRARLQKLVELIFRVAAHLEEDDDEASG